MGLASSQARLLSITARLSSNEYESQQISNAKMRLATQSQEASEAYIAALNDTQFSFVSYDSTGESFNTALTVATLYEYADNKNQYILTNAAGKVLLNNTDLNNYKNSNNLDEFLGKYGITKNFKTETLKDLWNSIFNKTGNTNYLKKYDNYWAQAIENYKSVYSADTWKTEKLNAQENYLKSLSKYTALVTKKSEGEDILNEDILLKQTTMETNRAAFTKLLSYESALESKIIAIAESNPSAPSGIEGLTYEQLYEGYTSYKNQIAKYNDELEELGLSANSAYKYSDTSKAQWYTNLWYKVNGPSTDKSGLDNYASFIAKDGIREYADGLIPANDAKILNSTQWISNALSKGLVSIEKAEYSGDEMTLQDKANPFKFNLNGISWKGQIYSSIPDIVESDNDKAVAQAEAEYQRRTAEINAKDEKYQRKISLLDSEHNAIQTEYDSVKSAMNKNIDRSFKAFQG